MYDITTLTDCLPLRNILKDVTLRDYQAVSALAIATNEARILIYSTGMGKTLAALGGLQARFNAGISKRFLWVGLLSSLHQVAHDIRTHTDFTFQTIKGDSESIESLLGKDFSSADGIIVNMEAFDNPFIVSLFHRFAYGEAFDTIIIDEAHLISNPFFSNRNSFIYMLAYRIRNCYLLTATPVISEIQQYAALIALATKELGNLFSIRAGVHKGEFRPENKKSLVCFRDRGQEFNCEVRRVEMDIGVDRAPGVTIFKYTRGPNASKVNAELLKIIQENKGKRFLIHCLLTQHHSFLKRFLQEEMGLRVGVISGTVKNSKEVQEAFNHGRLDCVVFSITSGLDLPSDYIIMYDWTVYAAQAIGRGLRKEVMGEYKVYLLLCTIPQEIKLCLNSVIKSGLLTEKALGINPLKQISLGGYQECEI